MVVTPAQQVGIAANAFLYSLAELRDAVETLPDGHLHDAWVDAVSAFNGLFEIAARAHSEETGQEMTPPAIRRPPYVD